MLTLERALTIEGYTVYRDDTVPHRFYVLPDKPSIALDENGDPIFSLIVYRRDEDRLDAEDLENDVGGGILTATVELAIGKDSFKRIERKLRSILYGEEEDNDELMVELDYVPYSKGRVEVGLMGEKAVEDAEGEFVKTMIGVGKVSAIGANRKAVMAKLTQDGAAMMAQLEDLPVLPIYIEYDLTFEHRLVGVTMEVFCNIQSAYTMAKTVAQWKWHEEDACSSSSGTKREITGLREEMSRDKICWVKVNPLSSEVDPDTLLALEKFGFDMLEREMANMFEAKPATDAQKTNVWLKDYESVANSNFNFQMDRKMVLERDHVASANVPNLIQGSWDKYLTFVDLGHVFFKFLKVPLRVNADFTSLPIDSVTVHLRYQRERVGTSEREEAVESYNFTDSSKIETFLAWANRLADVEYTWSADVHYKGEHETYHLRERKSDATFLVVDVADLGMMEVDVGLGLVDLQTFPKANITLRYESRALRQTLEKSFLLSQEQENVRWIEVIHEAPGEYEYKVDWLREDGDVLPGDWQKSNASRLRLDAPTGATMEITAVASGDFKEISQVLASFRYEDEANEYVEEEAFNFSAEGQVHKWPVTLRDPNLRAYKYRHTTVYKDGMVENVPEDPTEFLEGPPGFVVVGPTYDIECQILPLLLTFPDHAKIVKVNMTYADPERDINETDSFVFNEANKASAIWRVRTGIGPQPFTMTVTCYSTSGEETVMPTEVKEGNSVVIKPLPAPPVDPVPEPDPTPDSP